MSESAEIPETPRAWRSIARERLVRSPWLLPATAAFAVACLLLAAAGLGFALSTRGTGGGLSSTVIPARPDVQTAGSADATRAATASGAAAAVPSAAASTSLAPGLAQSAAAPAIIGGSCAAAPTVQFQGRGLAVTGTAPVTPSAPAAINLNVTVQERGGDAATVIANAQAKVQAVVSALQQAGVPNSAIQQSSFSSFGDFQGKQFTAYASVQAQVAGNDQLTQATKAILQISGVSGYVTSSALAVQPSDAEVQTAVSAAAAQARDMAGATARAAGVSLGNVQSVATQPPAVCYGPTGPMRVVQVTINYAIK
ncbi:MAG TPA: SIMPL domain-containing protein [Candidatus Dormibacteraeota bacterium]|nr:SIMPL domain-containing protein [Candidatus Dormibacteraeota bacterium]